MMVKVFLHSFRFVLKHTKMRICFLSQLIFCPGRHTRVNTGFQVTIQIFIRIELRGI
jgi:hypothetical protein